MRGGNDAPLLQPHTRKKARPTMLRKLTKSNATTWYYKDGDMVPGHPPDAYGNLSGVSGNLTDVWGNLDDCKITQEDREAGIHISELFADDAAESETK